MRAAGQHRIRGRGIPWWSMVDLYTLAGWTDKETLADLFMVQVSTIEKRLPEAERYCRNVGYLAAARGMYFKAAYPHLPVPFSV